MSSFLDIERKLVSLDREVRRLRSILSTNFTGDQIIVTNSNPNPVPAPQEGALIYGSASSEWARRPIGAAGTRLGSNGITLDWTDVLQLVPSDMTIVAGEIGVDRSQHRVDTEAAAASDDLDTISGGLSGQFLILRPVSSARTIVIKHNTGNILTNTGADLTLDDAEDWAMLIFDAAATKWYAR